MIRSRKIMSADGVSAAASDNQENTDNTAENSNVTENASVTNVGANVTIDRELTETELDT